MTFFAGLIGEFDDSIAMRVRTHLSAYGDVQRWSPCERVTFMSAGSYVNATAGGAENLLFAGTLANRSELYDAAGLCLRQRAQVADSELIHLLHARHGEAALDLLNGHYVVALWDARTKCLLVKRDRAGVCSAYYARVPGVLVFARAYKTILATGLIEPSPDRAAIAEYQHTGWVPRGRSFLANVASVPPGTTLLFDRDETHQRERSLPRPGSTISRSADAWKDVACHVEAAARKFATNEASVGVALSSGIDSSYLVGLVQATNPASTVHTFSVGYGRHDPELRGARRAAAYFGTVHHEVVVELSQVEKLLPEMVWHLEDPVGRDQYVCILALSRVAAQHVPVLLYGNGIDQAYGSTELHHHAYWASRNAALGATSEDYLNWLSSSAVPRRKSSQYVIRGMRAQSIPPPAAIAGTPAKVPRIELDAARGEALRPLLERYLLESDGKMGLKGKLIESASGCAMRMPFLDESLLAHALTLTDDEKIRFGIGKYCFRRAAGTLLPWWLSWRPKRIQHLEYGHAFSATMDALFDVYANETVVRNRGIFDYASVRRLRRPASARSYHPKHLYRLWYVVATEVWARCFLDQPVDVWALATSRHPYSPSGQGDGTEP